MILSTTTLRPKVENTVPVVLMKPYPASAQAGLPMDTWRAIGGNVAGDLATTNAGISHSSSSLSAIELPVQKAGNELRLIQVNVQSSMLGGVILMDRLVSTTNLNLNITTPQTVDTVALPRYTTGEGVEVFLYSQGAGAGGTAGTLVYMSYTNQDGVAGRTGVIQPAVGTLRQYAVQKFGLQGDDTGVRSVQSVTSDTIGRTGNYGLILAKRIVSFPVTPTVSNQVIGGTSLGFPVIHPEACLNSWYVCQATAGGVQLELKIANVPV